MRLITRWRDSAWAFWFWTGFVGAFPLSITVLHLQEILNPPYGENLRFAVLLLWIPAFAIWLIGAVPLALVWYVARRRERNRG